MSSAKSNKSEVVLGRLREAVNALGLNKSQLAAKIGYSKGQVGWILEGKTPLSDRFIRVFCLECNISESWIRYGVGDMGGNLVRDIDYGNDEFVNVPRYEIAASAGGGAVVHSEQIVDYLAFRADWVRSSLGVNPDRLAVISVIGDSMEPYLTDGDLILIDLSCTRIESDAIYIIQAGGALLVKRVQRRLDGAVVVRGDNEKYAPEIYLADQVDSLSVIGRLVRRLVR